MLDPRLLQLLYMSVQIEEVLEIHPARRNVLHMLHGTQVCIQAVREARPLKLQRLTLAIHSAHHAFCKTHFVELVMHAAFDGVLSWMSIAPEAVLKHVTQRSTTVPNLSMSACGCLNVAT